MVVAGYVYPGLRWGFWAKIGAGRCEKVQFSEKRSMNVLKYSRVEDNVDLDKFIVVSKEVCTIKEKPWSL